MEIANTTRYINKFDVKIDILVCVYIRVRINSCSTLYVRTILEKVKNLSWDTTNTQMLTVNSIHKYEEAWFLCVRAMTMWLNLDIYNTYN